MINIRYYIECYLSIVFPMYYDINLYKFKKKVMNFCITMIRPLCSVLEWLGLTCLVNHAPTTFLSVIILRHCRLLEHLNFITNVSGYP